MKPVVLPPVTDLSPYFELGKGEIGDVLEDRPIILFLGRLEPRKGVHVLLEAAKLLASGVIALPGGQPHPRFVVAGDGDERDAVLAARERLGSDWIDFIPSPSPEEHLQLLGRATLAVSPALYGESFGIVLVEALASGTPVIGADNAGYRTVLTGEGASLLVPAGDGEALARRIVELLATPGERKALAQWGRLHARQYDVNERVGDFENFYAGAIARHARSKTEG